MRFWRVLFPAVVTVLACFHASGQSVISARAGLVHFSEGSVFLDNQPLEQKFGTFPDIKEGSTLRTEHGRAEVLLTPGIFLRIDENSSIRMVSDALNDTRVEFLQGAVIVDSLDAPPANSVVAIYKDCKVRFPKQGIYRFDSEPAPLLQVYSGEAEVAYEGKVSSIDSSHLFFFAAVTETKKFDDGTDDEFFAWARDRSEAIASENQLATQTAQDPGDMDNGQTMLGDPTFGLGLPTYTPFGGIYSLGGAYFDPYVPFGMGYLGGYPVYPVFLSRYYLPSQYRRWPRGTGYPVLNPTRIGIVHNFPVRPSSFAYRPLPSRVGTVGAGFSRPAIVRAPRVGVTSLGPRPIGHR